MSHAQCRREFLRRVMLFGGVLGTFSIVPSRVLGLGGGKPPSETITMAAIGIGARGTGVLRWMLPEKDVRFLAVCDVRRASREAAKKVVDDRYGNADCAMFRDMRELFAQRPDIDAVMIALGDRWHALASILALRAGKDVYCEKPSTLTIAEGREVVKAAQRYSRVYQTGTQRLSEGNYIFAFELARSGHIGEIKRVRAQLTPYHSAVMRHDWLPEEPLPPKDEVDWDGWLGPCPWRPYNSAYVRGKWREYYDLHSGSIGEWGAHSFTQAQVGIGATDTSAVHYRYVNNTTGDGLTVRYASGVELVLQKEGWGLGHCGIRIEGTTGWVSAADFLPKPDASSPALLSEFNKLVNDYTERNQRPLSHVRDFFDCVRMRRPTIAGPELMHRAMTTIHASNICMWLKRDLQYDPAKEEFVGDEEANRLRARAMRAPWVI